MQDRGLVDIEWRITAFLSASITIYIVALSYFFGEAFHWARFYVGFLFQYLEFYMTSLFFLTYLIIVKCKKSWVKRKTRKSIGWLYILCTAVVPTIIFYVSSEII